VPNTFTEHDFKDAFKKQQKRCEEEYFKGDGAMPVGRKLVSDPMASLELEIMNGSSYSLGRLHGSEVSESHKQSSGSSDGVSQ
jgi:hypothetical protein